MVATSGVGGVIWFRSILLLISARRKQHRWLNTENHPADQQTTEEDFPETDFNPEDYSRQEEGPEWLGEDDGESVPERHVEDTGELE